jgi:hypothetical protein
MKKMDSSLEWELGLTAEIDERIGLAAAYRGAGADSEALRQR